MDLRPLVVWSLAAAGLVLPLLVYLGLARRLERARRAERSAAEQRDRFFAVAAAELDAPLAGLRRELATLATGDLGEPRDLDARAAALTQRIDDLRAQVSELGRVPAPIVRDAVEVDVGELVRAIVAQPPFSVAGPTVIVRAAAAPVYADRARLETGLRVLLWVARREVDPRASLEVTVSTDEGLAWIEIDTGGAGELAEALEQLPVVRHGLAAPTAAPGSTLALAVASQVARAHGGRLSASARVGRGERFVLELPAATTVH